MLVIVCGGCFNPPGVDDESGTTATIPPATSTGPTTSGTMTTAPETTGTTTEPVAPTTAGTCVSGCGETTSTGSEATTGTTTTEPGTETTATAETTEGPAVLFVPLAKLTHDGAYSLAVADFEKDGKADLVISSENAGNNLGVIFGASQTIVPHMVPGTKAVGVADVGGDMDDDVVTLGGAIYILAWTGGALMNQPVVVIGDGCLMPYDVVVGQLDPTVDMAADAVVVCSDDIGALHVARGEPGATFKPPTRVDTDDPAQSLALAGVLGPMSADLLAVDPSLGRVFVYPGNDDVSFNLAAKQVLEVGQALRVAAGDLDGVAPADFVVAALANKCPVYLGSDGPPAPAGTYDCGNNPFDVQLADIDGDGDGDVVSLHVAEVHIGLNNGDGTFAPPLVQSVEPSVYRLAIGDFDGNGRRDLAVTSLDTVQMFLQVEG